MAGRKTHKGSIERLASGSLRVRIQVGGGRRSFTLPTMTTRSEAAKFADAKFEELEGEAKRVGLGLPGRIRFSDLIKRFEESQLPALSAGTQKSYGSSFLAFTKFFVDERGDPEVQAIRKGNIREFMAWRRSHRSGTGRGPISPHTIAKDRRVLDRLFGFAVELEVIEISPVRKVRPPKADERTPIILTEPELERLLGNLSEHHMAGLYILFLAETGLRAYSEGLHLRWEDVDFQGRVLTCP